MTDVPRDIVITKMHAQCLSCLKTSVVTELCLYSYSLVHSVAHWELGPFEPAAASLKSSLPQRQVKGGQKAQSGEKQSKRRSVRLRRNVGSVQRRLCSPAASSSWLPRRALIRLQRGTRERRGQWGPAEGDQDRGDTTEGEKTGNRGKTHKCRALMLSSMRWHYTHTDDSINLWQSLRLVFRLRGKKSSNIYCWQNLLLKTLQHCFRITDQTTYGC